MVNSLLERQIRKHLYFLSSEELEKINPFLQAVEEGYIGFENDRKLMERSLEISSGEFHKISETLRNNAQEKQNIIDQLVAAIKKIEELKGVKGNIDKISIDNATYYLRNLIDENLRNQEKLEILNRAINTSNVTVIVWEKERNGEKKKIKFVSKNIEKNFGYPYNDFLSGRLQFEDIVIAEDKPHFHGAHTPPSGEQTITQTEYRVKNARGETVWVSEQAIFEFKNEGQDLEHEGIIIDITALKQKQQEVEENEKYLSTIVSNIGEGVCVIDSQKRIKLFNPIGGMLFGIKQDQVLGKGYLEYLRFHHISTGELYRELIPDNLETAQVETIFDDICIRTDSKNIPVSIIISPIRGFSKGMLEKSMQGWIVVFRDKTKEKELEDIKNELLSVASHELRTPMTVINGYASLLMEEKVGQVNEQQKKYLSRIKDNTIRLINLVNDVLTLSKIESGKMNFEYTNFDIGELIRDVLSAFSLSAEEKKISLSGDIRDCYIQSDRAKLDQVLINLVGNALKFTPKNGIIYIKVDDNEEENTITVRVRDNGIGIKPEDIEGLFSKFYQATQNIEKKEAGTGLGLNICKGIITKLKGEIGVISEYGKGSEFYFTIPKKQS